MNLKIATGFYLLFLFCSMNPLAAQDSMDELLQEITEDEENESVSAVFKSTRIINGHSVENLAEGVLDFRISHRFGSLDQGARNFFGLDNAQTKLSFEYGLLNNLMLGLGRSTYQKEFDGFVKLSLFKQTVDNRMPLNISYFASVFTQSLQEVPGEDILFTDRISYVNQLLIAHKFNDNLSLQLSPSHIHYNIVPNEKQAHDVLALGLGGRMKFTSRTALTMEYFYTLPQYSVPNTCNSLSIGVDIETGGHVFQLMLTNSIAMNERVFIGETNQQWESGEIHFGFNISRVFTLK